MTPTSPGPHPDPRNPEDAPLPGSETLSRTQALREGLDIPENEADATGARGKDRAGGADAGAEGR